MEKKLVFGVSHKLGLKRQQPNHYCNVNIHFITFRFVDLVAEARQDGRSVQDEIDKECAKELREKDSKVTIASKTHPW